MKVESDLKDGDISEASSPTKTSGDDETSGDKESNSPAKPVREEATDGVSAEAKAAEVEATDASTEGITATAEGSAADVPNSVAAALTESRWEEMFQRLLKFKEMAGHCLVPIRYKEDLQLGRWVDHQRKNYKVLESGRTNSGTLTPERAKRLMDVGFEWTAKNPRHLMWEVRFAELKDFKDRYGHPHVPIGWDRNVQLSNWVSTQRQEYKNLVKGKTSRLNERRVQLLEDVGFAWELQRGGRRRRMVGDGTDPVDGEEVVVPNIPAANETSGADSFAVEDPNSPKPISVGGRCRTTLKKKQLEAPSNGKSILPGIAILGGSKGGQKSSPTRSRATDDGGGYIQYAGSDPTPLSTSSSNQALLIALGNTNNHNQPFQVATQPPGAQQHHNHQQQQHQTAFSHHLMNPTQGGYNSSGATHGMSPFAGSFNQGATNLYNAQTQYDQQEPSHIGSLSENNSLGGGEIQFGSWPNVSQQQAQYWRNLDPNSAASLAAQHLQAAAALTAGLDERYLPPELASIASIARRINMQVGGNYGGSNGGQPQNMMPTGMPSNFAQQYQTEPQQYQPKQASRRGRIGDPPADPPTYGHAPTENNNSLRRADPDTPNKKRRLESNSGRPDIFDDANE